MKTNLKLTLVLIIGFIHISCGGDGGPDPIIIPDPPPVVEKYETFTFLSNGAATKAKIYLPDAYKTNKNLPTIYLIDFEEQHFTVARDEFEKVIDGVKRIDGFDALVVALESIPNIDAQPDKYQEYYTVFKNMASYVDSKYTSNTSRTFIGRGSEAGIVLMTLFKENSETSIFDNFIVTDPSTSFMLTVINMIEKDNFPKNKLNKKLHFSFSISNDYDKCTKIINLINQAKYPWLQFDSIEYSDSDYEHTYPVAYVVGIKYVFNK